MRVIPLRPLLVVSVLCLFAACEKYPEDIPPWVRERIKYCAKEKNDCRSLVIVTYDESGRKIYLLHQTAPLARWEYYGEDGTLLCGWNSGYGPLGPSDCQGLDVALLDSEKLIWTEKSKH